MTEAPPRSCIFVGGIHGVGKSSLCIECARFLRIVSYTASELIRHYNDRDAGLYKEVVSVSSNQDSLVNALRARPNVGPYLLDGHFVIRSKTSGISQVPCATFKAIGPRGIIVVTGDPEVAAQRMLERDSKCIGALELREMQRLEIDHGRRVGRELGIKIIELHSPTISDFVFSVSALIGSHAGGARDRLSS